MGVRRRWVIVVAITGIFLLEGRLLPADNVKLDGGGSLSGSVTTGSRWVSVRTPTGALMVFDRADIKQVSAGTRRTENGEHCQRSECQAATEKTQAHG